MYCTFTESWGCSNFVQCSCFQSCKTLRVPILFNIFTSHHVTSFSIKLAINWGNYWIFSENWIYLHFCRMKSLFFLWTTVALNICTVYCSFLFCHIKPSLNNIILMVKLEGGLSTNSYQSHTQSWFLAASMSNEQRIQVP